MKAIIYACVLFLFGCGASAGDQEMTVVSVKSCRIYQGYFDILLTGEKGWKTSVGPPKRLDVEVWVDEDGRADATVKLTVPELRQLIKEYERDIENLTAMENDDLKPYKPKAEREP